MRAKHELGVLKSYINVALLCIQQRDPVVVDHWFQQVERVFEAMEITSNPTKIRLATFRLEGES